MNGKQLKHVHPKPCSMGTFKVMAVVGGQRYRFRGTYVKAMEFAAKVNKKIDAYNERVTSSSSPDKTQFSESFRLSF